MTRLVFHLSGKFSEERPGRKALVGNSVRPSSSMEVTSLIWRWAIFELKVPLVFLHGYTKKILVIGREFSILVMVPAFIT